MFVCPAALVEPSLFAATGLRNMCLYAFLGVFASTCCQCFLYLAVHGCKTYLNLNLNSVLAQVGLAGVLHTWILSRRA
jgi:hypothetical protein